MSLLRRDVLAASFAVAAGLATRATADVGADRDRLWLRLIADPAGRPVFSVEEGVVWGFKPQADDLTTDAFARRLYGYGSIIARKAVWSAEAVDLTTAAWTFYRDKDSGAVIETLHNPYTGKTVQCPPLAAPPAVTRFTAASPAPDLRRSTIGETAFIEINRVTRFKPEDTTWFKLEADLVTHLCRPADLDRRDGFVPSTWTHNVVAEWQTWMHMHGAPGHILFRGGGALVASLDAAPKALLAAAARRFPEQLDAVRAWR